MLILLDQFLARFVDYGLLDFVLIDKFGVKELQIVCYLWVIRRHQIFLSELFNVKAAKERMSEHFSYVSLRSKSFSFIFIKQPQNEVSGHG